MDLSIFAKYALLIQISCKLPLICNLGFILAARNYLAKPNVLRKIEFYDSNNSEE